MQQKQLQTDNIGREEQTPMTSPPIKLGANRLFMKPSPFVTAERNLSCEVRYVNGFRVIVEENNYVIDVMLYIRIYYNITWLTHELIREQVFARGDGGRGTGDGKPVSSCELWVVGSRLCDFATLRLKNKTPSTLGRGGFVWCVDLATVPADFSRLGPVPGPPTPA